jgi:excisionase family DNA binding protein
MVTNWETLKGCASRLNISGKHLRRLMDDGQIPFYRIGKRRIALDPREVDRAIEENFRQGAK